MVQEERAEKVQTCMQAGDIAWLKLGTQKKPGRWLALNFLSSELSSRGRSAFPAGSSPGCADLRSSSHALQQEQSLPSPSQLRYSLVMV